MPVSGFAPQLESCPDMAPPSLLITGGTGYLGSRLLAALVHRGSYRLAVLVRRSSKLERLVQQMPKLHLIYTDECDYLEVLAQQHIDLIVHCATNYGRQITSQLSIVEANLVLPLRLLDAALASDRHIGFINTDTMLDKGISAYSLSKKQFREWLQRFGETRLGINVALEHFFGAGDDPTKFVSIVVRALIAGEPSLRLTAGEQERDFIYIDDAVEALVRIIIASSAAQSGFQEYEIGRGQPVRIRDFVELARTISGNTTTRLDFGGLPYRDNEVMRIVADTSRIRSLGWSPGHSLREGLVKMFYEELT